MELLALKYCDIFRDGGSLEGTWTTTENSEWSVFLKVDSYWARPEEFKNRRFKLYNCSHRDFKDNVPIDKDSPACKEIIQLVTQWVIKNRPASEDLKQDKFNRLFQLVDALQQGNY